MNGTTGTSERWQQTILASPENELLGIYGNCMQAAVATLLGMPMEAVPHFAAFDFWDFALDLWAKGRGLKWERFTAGVAPDEPCLLVGRSPRGFMHTIVSFAPGDTWDPHPSGDGLTSIAGWWRFTSETS